MRYTFNNRLGTFSIDLIGGKYYVTGKRRAAALAFREIGRKPPNKYGNFYGREKAGFKACEELINTAGGSAT